MTWNWSSVASDSKSSSLVRSMCSFLSLGLSSSSASSSRALFFPKIQSKLKIFVLSWIVYLSEHLLHCFSFLWCSSSGLWSEVSLRWTWNPWAVLASRSLSQHTWIQANSIPSSRSCLLRSTLDGDCSASRRTFLENKGCRSTTPPDAPSKAFHRQLTEQLSLITQFIKVQNKFLLDSYQASHRINAHALAGPESL